MNPTYRSKTGSILKEYTGAIPVGTFDIIADVINKIVDKKSGIYALYNNNELYYVGLTRDLKKRLNRHMVNKHAGKWNKFRIFLVKTKYLRDVESIILTISMPIGNTKGGILPNRGKYDKLIKKAISQKIKESNKLKRDFN